MGFYENYEYVLYKDTLTVDDVTSDIIHNTNYNSNYLLSTLNDFFDKTHIDLTLMEQFNEELYQRLVYENLIDYNDPDARISFTYNKAFPVSYTIPFGYEYAKEYDSIITSGINLISHYLEDKFEYFDFSTVNNQIERLDEFNVFNFYLKLMNMLDCTMYQEIQNTSENLYEMLEDMPIKDKINKIKDKSYVAIMWNNLLNYFGKCDPDLQQCFVSQSWEFISDYITRRI